MHIGILSCNNPKNEDSISDRHPEYAAGSARLAEAAEKRGHQVTRFYAPRFCFVYNEGKMAAWYDGEPFQGVDTIIYRSNFIEEPSLHSYVPAHLTGIGQSVINATPNVAVIKNKITQHMHLATAKLPTPAFALGKDAESTKLAIESLGFPIIVKVPFGTHGKGVFYAANWETCQPILDYLNVRDGNPVILEEFIAAAKSKDIRAFVIGGKVVASMERQARGHDIRANASLGGKGVAIQLSAEDEVLAIRAAQVFDLEIAGVDLIRSDRGTLILEVNANPGFQELEACTGIDVAGAIIDYAEQLVAKSKAS